MTESVWWYVLAGFLLGFILSTLWEWAYFRSRRLRIENRRIAELEASVRAHTPASGAAAGPIFPAVDYQGSGAILETEQAETEVLTTIHETRTVEPAQPGQAAPATPVQPTPGQRARRTAAVSARSVSTQPAPAQPPSDQFTAAEPSPVNNTTVIVEQRAQPAQPMAETPPVIERSATVVVQPQEQEAAAGESNTTVTVEQAEPPQQERPPEPLPQRTWPPSPTASATASTAPPAAEQATPLYDSRNGHEHRNGFAGASASSTSAPVEAVPVDTSPAEASKPATVTPETVRQEPVASTSEPPRPPIVQVNIIESPATEPAGIGGEDTERRAVEPPVAEPASIAVEAAPLRAAEPVVIEVETTEAPIVNVEPVTTATAAEPAIATVSTVVEPPTAEATDAEVGVLEAETEAAEAEIRAAAAAAGMAAVLAAEQAQEDAVSVSAEPPAQPPAGPLPLHSFLPAAAKAAERSGNGNRPQTDSSARAVEPAGIQPGIQRVTTELDSLLTSLKGLADTTDPLLDAMPSSDEARLGVVSSPPSTPEAGVTGLFAARNLSRTEYAVVRLMQSTRRLGRELRSLYRRE